MSDRDFLSGFVAQVINERELAINIGSNHGVKVGMTFAVLAESPLVITDPISGEELGSEDRPKVNVKADRVYEKFTICRTYRKTGGRPGLFSAAAVAALNPANATIGELYGIEGRDETLRADKESLPAPLSPEESFVKAGDRVVQTIDS